MLKRDMFIKFKNSVSVFVTCFMLLVSSSTLADTLVLKNGMTLQGTFKGGNEATIQFETGGAVQNVQISDIESLTFAASSDTAAPPGAAVATLPAQAVASGPVTIPAGTMMMVKLDKAISTASHQKGAVMTGLLEQDLVVDKQVVAPKGTLLYGVVVESVGGKRLGNQKIGFQFNSIMINNEKVAIVTPPLGAEGGRGGALKTVAGAALIGGAIDGNSGAKTGALVGAGAAVLAGGRHIQIPAGTLAEIPINQAVTID